METKYLNAHLPGLYETYRSFELIVDSRRVTNPGKCLFFALPGRRTHGVAYLQQLLAQGVCHFVVPSSELNRARPQVQSFGNEQGEVQGTENKTTLLVADDPVEVLQGLAAYHRGQSGALIVGITGSNGKTIIKDWLAILLNEKFSVCASPRSFNSQIGVPLSVWQLKEGHDIGIFEAGISTTGEMERLERILQPDFGIFTNIGSAHADGFPDEVTKLREKIGLFKGAKLTIVPPDPPVMEAMAGWSSQVFERRVYREVVTTPKGSRVEIRSDRLPDVYLDNAAAAITMASLLGVEDTALERLSAKFKALSNRLEQTEGLHGAPIINDSYSNDLDALAAAINFSCAQSPSGKIHLILGVIQPPASDSVPGTRDRALQQLLGDRIETLVLVGERPGQALPERTNINFTGTEEALHGLAAVPFSKIPILVKGASSQHFDRIARSLSRKQHRTVLRIDLGALQHNFRVYKDKVSAKMIAMVKASAYGGGSLPIARALQEAGAEYLAVAYTDEGRELRNGGIRLPILVLNPEPDEFNDLLEAGLEPVVGSQPALQQAAALQIPVHLELDTGMARLGIKAEEAVKILNSLPDLPFVKSIFSHLAGSENAGLDDFSRRQHYRFLEASERISEFLGYKPFRHLLNSNGISRFPHWQYEAVRLGIGLFGIGDELLTDELKPVLRLTTRVARISRVAAGESVGYGRGGLLSRDSRIATISMGYADGLPRLAGKGAFKVSIKGVAAPIVGSVCMDMTMVDVSDHLSVAVGDEVVIFNDGASVDKLAAAAGTIPYEILTGIGERVHRIYSRE